MIKRVKNSLPYKILREIKNLSVDEARYFFIRIKLALESIYDIVQDGKLGIETGQYISEEDRSLYKDMNPSIPASYPALRKILDHLRLGPADVFVDIGCGKGRAVFMAGAEKIKKAIGIELDGEIIAIALDNLRSIKTPLANVEFIRGDAAAAEMGEGTVFFMYNPFGYKTLSKVVDNIKASLADKPRGIRIVYYSPIHRELFENEDWLKMEKTLDDMDMVIWTNKI